MSSNNDKENVAATTQNSPSPYRPYKRGMLKKLAQEKCLTNCLFSYTNTSASSLSSTAAATAKPSQPVINSNDQHGSAAAATTAGSGFGVPPSMPLSQQQKQNVAIIKNVQEEGNSCYPTSASTSFYNQPSHEPASTRTCTSPSTPPSSIDQREHAATSTQAYPTASITPSTPRSTPVEQGNVAILAQATPTAPASTLRSLPIEQGNVAISIQATPTRVPPVPPPRRTLLLKRETSIATQPPAASTPSTLSSNNDQENSSSPIQVATTTTTLSFGPPLPSPSVNNDIKEEDHSSMTPTYHPPAIYSSRGKFARGGLLSHGPTRSPPIENPAQLLPPSSELSPPLSPKPTASSSELPPPPIMPEADAAINNNENSVECCTAQSSSYSQASYGSAGSLPKVIRDEFSSTFFRATGKPGLYDLRRAGIEPPKIVFNPKHSYKYSSQDDWG